jgi:hypothetical protein
MDKDRIEGSAKEIKGKIKEVAGKVLGDAKLARLIHGGLDFGLADVA